MGLGNRKFETENKILSIDKALAEGDAWRSGKAIGL
jgi:hypothetical protein